MRTCLGAPRIVRSVGAIKPKCIRKRREGAKSFWAPCGGSEQKEGGKPRDGAQTATPPHIAAPHPQASGYWNPVPLGCDCGCHAAARLSTLADTAVPHLNVSETLAGVRNITFTNTKPNGPMLASTRVFYSCCRRRSVCAASPDVVRELFRNYSLE